jgi:FtsP/CotA-like multicopper oxidase with cupredoxin domain
VDLQRGMCPGPEIRVKRNGEVRVRLINGLDEPTMLHWHGIRIENAMDGSPLTQNPVPLRARALTTCSQHLTPAPTGIIRTSGLPGRSSTACTAR